MLKIATAANIGVRRAWLGVGAPIIGLVAVIMALAVAVFASFAGDQDKAFERGTRTLVMSDLEGRARMVDALALDYANWDDTFENVSVRWNQEWIDNMLYSGVVDATVLFRQNGVARFVWAEDAYAEQADAIAAAVANAGAQVPNLRRLARAPAAADTVTHTYARVGEYLLIIAVAPVTLEDDAARIAHNPLSGYDYLAAVRIIDSEGFAQIGRSMSVDNLQFLPRDAADPADVVVQPVNAADGDEIGKLVWRHAHPGAAAFQARIWPVVLSLLLIGALTLWIARYLVRRQISAMAGAESVLEATRVRTEFLAKVGHGLRTPLDSIIGYAELIQEETESPAAHADAERIVSAARHLNQLLIDILDQSRLHAGTTAIKSEVLAVAGMVAEVQGVMRTAARTAGVTLTAQSCATANYVVADHARLRQCLLNLIGNAIKFAPRGAVAIKARLEQRPGGDVVVFDITDDGIGISKAEQEKLFKPFSQANAQIGEIYGGAGLGLSIARDLVRAMGGDVTVRSELGAGSTFSLSVPVASPKALQAA